MNTIRISLVALLLSLPSLAAADIIITIGQAADIGSSPDTPLGPFAPGTLVSIPFLAHLDTGTVPSNDLTSYSFAFDIGGDGDGIPGTGGTPYFDDFNFTSGIGGTLTPTPTTGLGQPYDFIVLWSGTTPISTDASMPSTLFTLDFDSNVSTPVATYAVNHVATPFDSGTGGGGAFTGANMQFDQGEFNISAVPEPGSVALLGVAGAAGIGFIRRKKRASLESNVPSS